MGCLNLLHLYTQLIITSATELPLIYTLQLTVTHTLEFSDFTSCILATDFNIVIIPVSLNYTLQIPHIKSSLHMLIFKYQLNLLPSLLSYLRLSFQETPSIIVVSAGLRCSLYSLVVDPTENTVSSITAQQYLDCCLLIRCCRNVSTELLSSN
jgi:hypothetical protein